MRYRIQILLLLFVVAWLPLGSLVSGQEGVTTPAESAPAVTQPSGPEQPAGAGAGDAGAGDAGAGDKDPLREQTIYIPYEKLKNVFEKPGRGVFVPYEKFQELWNAARARTRAEQSPERPVDAVITEIDNDATIADQVVNVQAKLQIEILGKGWVLVPLRLRNAAIRSAKVGDASARIVLNPEIGHQLLWHKEGEAPEQVELLLEYTRAFAKTPGQSSVEFEAPQAPINRWRIRVPEAGMSVQVEPMIAATQAPQDPAGAATASSDLLAFVGAAPTVKISWNPKAEGATGLEAFATVQAEQQLVISEGVARSSIKLDYEISRAKLTQLVLEIPADQKVVNVVDRNVQRWNFETAEGKQLVRVDLFEATQGRQSLQVELEQFSNAAESSYEVAIPLVRAVGIGRQQGIVVVRVEEGQQGEAVRRAGLLQLDQNDLPESLRGTKWDFAYRYGAVPYELAISVDKVLPRISVTELVEADLTAEKLTLNWQGLYTIEEAGLFQLRVDLPDGFEVRAVEGKVISECEAAAVDSYHRVAADANTWLVNLSKKAFGKVGLSVQLERQLDDPNLRSPTGTASTLPVPLPRATAADVEFAQGSVVVNAPESLHINPAEDDGLRSISFAEAFQTIPATPAGSKPLLPVLAYAFAKGATQLAVTAERRQPQVTVNQLVRAEITSGVVKFNVSLFYDIKYSGVKSLRLDVPTALAADIHNASKSLSKEEITPKPEDVAEGYTPWKFAAETELLGATEVELAWEQKIDELGIGKSVAIAIPRLIPNDVFRATGQIVISKSESIDIQPTGQPSGLLPIDPQKDLLPQGRSDTAAMAFEFVGDWSLSVQATRYELETSKLTSIERGVVRIVALSQGELWIQAIYRMRSARQRLTIGLPETAEFDSQPLRIDGHAVNPERESTGVIFAPLADQDIDKPFVLELRYSIVGTSAQLDLPFFPDDPAVQKVYLCAYLPQQEVLLASAGPWSDEQRSDQAPISLARRYISDQELLQWVAEGNATAASSAQTFQTGKSHLHVYSTLRPQQAPDGSLQLSTMNRNGFHALVILVLAVTGVPLFRRSLRLQLVWLLLIAAAVLLIGVFIPELARTLFEGVFPIALVILVIIWLIGHVSNLRWSRRKIAAPPAEPQATSPFGSEAAVATGVTGAEEEIIVAESAGTESPSDTDTAANDSDEDMPQDGGRRNA
ncbi:MAG: hypothetical protein ACYC3X_11245 [Pirellulaceae bacterium]